jgi:PilZ domain
MTVIDLAEARKGNRRQALDMALIRCGDRSVSCVIRNLTDAGAALDIGPQSELPDQFTLIVLAKKKIYSCNVVWRKDRRIGVSFAEARKPDRSFEG